MKKSLYDILNVEKDASKEDIKSAYRHKAKENHPDKGGDNETMSEISKAYSILSDDRKRDRYDTTGQEDDHSFEQKFMELIATYFNQIIEGSNVDCDDLIGAFKSIFREIESNMKKAKAETGENLKKIKNVRKRIKSKNDNAIIIFLDGQIKAAENRIAGIKEEMEFMKQAKSVLEQYNYDFDKFDETEVWERIKVENIITG